jgi:hypothetical protein
MQADLAFTLHVGEYVADLGREAVTMHIPVGTGMTQKSPLLFQRQRTPNVLRHRPEAVDH